MLIEIKNCFSLILKDVNLSIKEGEFVALTGPNGAGKTTLLHLITGLIKPQKGEIIVNTRKIGYVPQRTYIDKRTPVKVKDLVFMALLSSKRFSFQISKNEIENCESMMKKLGIYELRERAIGTLSGGEQQKALLCHALCREPQLLLLDEPFVNLDITSQKEFLRLIEKVYKEKNLTIILVTHLFHLIPRSCKRVILLDKGKVLFDGERDVFFSTL